MDVKVSDPQHSLADPKDPNAVVSLTFMRVKEKLYFCPAIGKACVDLTRDLPSLGSDWLERGTWSGFEFGSLFLEPSALYESIKEVAAVSPIQQYEYTHVLVGSREFPGTCFWNGSFAFSTTSDPPGKPLGLHRWCFTLDGVFIQYQHQALPDRNYRPWEGRLRAFEVSREVSDADFELPYPLWTPGTAVPTP
jgi:hypothetical protein